MTSGNQLPAGDGPAAGTSSGRRMARVTFQVAAFILGLAMLGWCVSQAFQPANRDQLERLSDAAAWQIGALIALSLLSVVLDGVIFWVTLRPVRRLRPADVVAVNALAVFLAYLPFKLSVICRAAVHNRRDKVPLATIGAWFAAVALLLLAAVVPLVVASLWRGRIDAAWWAAAVGLALAGCGALVGVARMFRGDQGIDRLHRLVDPLRLRFVQSFLRTRVWANLHDGFAMIASPWATAAAVILRVVQMAAQGARFAVAADILGQHLGAGDALLVALVFFIAGVLSPAGNLGFREFFATRLAGPLAIAHSSSFAPVPLLVGATDAVVNLGCAAAALAWLRVDRLVRATGRQEAPPEAARPAAPAGEKAGAGPSRPRT